MKTKSILFILSFCFAIIAKAQFPNFVTPIKAVTNQTVTITGNLANGKLMNDLSWAWQSSVACFPGTQKQKFTGKHVLFSTNLPPKSIMNITVEPLDKNANFSLYAYQIGTTNYSVVPNLPSCVSCEADHKWDYPRRGKTQDHTRSVELNAIKNPYNVVIGVVGANGLQSGKFKLHIKLEGGEPQLAIEQKPIIPIEITCPKGETREFKADLSKGVIIHDLSWAWRSSVACFPETQKKKFTGKHMVYTTEIPNYSNMEITLTPHDKTKNFSLYAYMVGRTSRHIVPNLPSCVTCEVDHKWDYKKRNQTQDHTRKIKNLTAINNPYKVVIGVTGADGLDKGGYTLRVKVTGR